MTIDLNGFTDSIHIVAVAAAPGALLAIGEPFPGTCGGPVSVAGVWRSTDGLGWSRLRLSSEMTAGSIRALNGGAAGFIATGSRHDGKPAIWLSEDGLTWHSSVLPSVASGKLVVQDGQSIEGGFVLSGAVVGPEGCGGASEIHPATWWSANGTAWTRETLPGASSSADATLWMEKIADDDLIAIEQTGDNPKLAWRSSDGRTWQAIAAPSDEAMFGLIGDGRHALSTIDEGLAGNGAITMRSVARDLTTRELVQTGDAPLDVDGGPRWGFVVGPTGVVAFAADGSSIRLGLPSS